MSRNTATNYLKAIYAEVSASGAATGKALARRLRVTPATVSSVVKRLEREGMVLRGRRGEISLTPTGLREAARVVRKHRLLETFLHSTLGYPLETLHLEATALEAVVSDTLAEKLDEFLGRPSRDPHGHPIPRGEVTSRGRRAVSGLAPRATGCSLEEATPGVRFVVCELDDEDGEAVRRLAHYGILPGTPLVVLEGEPYGGPLWVEARGSRIPLARGLAGKVRVERIRGGARARGDAAGRRQKGRLESDRVGSGAAR